MEETDWDGTEAEQPSTYDQRANDLGGNQRTRSAHRGRRSNRRPSLPAGLHHCGLERRPQSRNTTGSPSVGVVNRRTSPIAMVNTKMPAFKTEDEPATRPHGHALCDTDRAQPTSVDHEHSESETQ